MEAKIRSSQSKMERCILGIKWQEHKTNLFVKSQTQFRDILKSIKQSKWRWAGHIARADPSQSWAAAILQWVPKGKRNRGRQRMRWEDEIVKFSDKNWIAKTSNRGDWRCAGEAFAQQWDTSG
jgi:hypothetical protein